MLPSPLSSLMVMALIGLSLLVMALTVILSLIPLYLPTRTIGNGDGQQKVVCASKFQQNQIQIFPPHPSARNHFARKTRIDCPIVILGAGVAGAHSAYRLAPTHKNQICIFDRNSFVGGRAYDRDYNGNVPGAYDTTAISAQGAERSYEVQTVIKQLADELKIPYYNYSFQTELIKQRGQLYTSVNQMCASSYTNLTCNDDSRGYNAQDQMRYRLIGEYSRNPASTHRFGDLPAFGRYVLGDEGFTFLRESFRLRGYVSDNNAYGFMERYVHEFTLNGTIYYPNAGMSQFPKRMLFKAMHSHQVQLYLNEEVLRMDDNTDRSCYPFTIETTRYHVRAQQLIVAMDPTGWQAVTGSIATEIKSDRHFQAVMPVKTAAIQCYWPRRWWEESAMFASDVDRASTTQNCINLLEIISHRPAERAQNLTRLFCDEPLCAQMRATLIARPSQEDLIEEIRRGLQALFIDVQIPPPKNVLAQFWPEAYHLQYPSSTVSNKEITRWALQPLARFTRNQLSLTGEAFFLDRAAWIEAAVKSSLISLASQFDFKFNCYDNDLPSTGGRFCTSDFV